VWTRIQKAIAILLYLLLLTFLIVSVLYVLNTTTVFLLPILLAFLLILLIIGGSILLIMLLLIPTQEFVKNQSVRRYNRLDKKKQTHVETPHERQREEKGRKKRSKDPTKIIAIAATLVMIFLFLT
jgi:hypothetical protein